MIISEILRSKFRYFSKCGQCDHPDNREEKINMKRDYPVILGILIFIMGTALSAQNVDTVHAGYRYVMGDSDSKTEAKQLCFLEAKRLCLEQAGTYIQSQVKVENYQVTQDEITTYSASFVQVELVSEEFETTGETMAINTTVRAVVDADYLRDQLEQMKDDEQLTQQVKEQESERQQLEKNVFDLHKELQRASPEQRERLRQQMATALKNVSEFENRKQILKNRTYAAIKNIKPGMTPEQVLKNAGVPLDKIKHSGDLRLNYGLVWVIFQKNRVTCLVKAPHFKPQLKCRDYPPKQRWK